MPAYGQSRDLDLTRRQLGAWLAGRLPAGAAPEVSNLQVPQTSGFSNETILFDACWRENGTSRSAGLVARIRPTGRAVFPEYDMRLQYRCMEILGAASDVPVPPVRWFEERTDVLGEPFYVMEKVDAQVPSDNPPYTVMGWVVDATAAQQEALFRRSIAMLARVHALDWRRLGFGFLDRPTYGAAGFDQQLGYYREYLPWASGGAPPAELVELLAWLERNRPRDLGPVVLNWGDARISNMMYRDFAPVAVLDWEMATLGPAEVDLAWFLFMHFFLGEALGIAPLPGFPGDAALVAHYEEAAGRRMRDLHYFTMWAAFRFAVVMVAINQVMLAHGIEMGAPAHLLAFDALTKVRARG